MSGEGQTLSATQNAVADTAIALCREQGGVHCVFRDGWEAYAFPDIHAENQIAWGVRDGWGGADIATGTVPK